MCFYAKNTMYFFKRPFSKMTLIVRWTDVKTWISHQFTSFYRSWFLYKYILIPQKPHKKFAHNLKLYFQKTASKMINLTKRYDHLRTRRIIFHVFNVNLVFNSDVSNLSPTLTAYNFFFQFIFRQRFQRNIWSALNFLSNGI